MKAIVAASLSCVSERDFRPGSGLAPPNYQKRQHVRLLPDALNEANRNEQVVEKTITESPRKFLREQTGRW
jgi:hypothetical protein